MADAPRQRRRVFAHGATVLLAASLGVQLTQRGALADDNLLFTGPVAALGAILLGLGISTAAAIAAPAAVVSCLWVLAARQVGRGFADDIVLFALPMALVAAVVMCRGRHLSGAYAIGFAVALGGLVIAVGAAPWPDVAAIVYMAVLLALRFAPLPPSAGPS